MRYIIKCIRGRMAWPRLVTLSGYRVVASTGHRADKNEIHKSMYQRDSEYGTATHKGKDQKVDILGW